MNFLDPFYSSCREFGGVSSGNSLKDFSRICLYCELRFKYRSQATNIRIYMYQRLPGFWRRRDVVPLRRNISQTGTDGNH